MTPQNTPLEISEEAKTAALQEADKMQVEVYGHFVQLAINSATAKLRKENERLKYLLDTAKSDATQETHMRMQAVAICDQLKLRVEELERVNANLMEQAHTWQTRYNVQFESNNHLRNGVESLQKQIVGLREAFKFPAITRGNLESICWHLVEGEDNGGISREGLRAFLDSILQSVKKVEAICESTNLSHLYVRREVLKKCVEALALSYEVTEYPANGKSKQDEALTIARKELGE